MKFFALLIAAASATTMRQLAAEPWLPESLPACPEPSRTIMDDGETHVTKYPYVGIYVGKYVFCKKYVGATCVAQVSSSSQ